MMNPKALFQMKSILDRLKQNHPKVPLFFQAAGSCIDEGSVIEITLTTSAGKSICTNMRVTADDLDAVRTLQEQLKK